MRTRCEEAIKMVDSQLNSQSNSAVSQPNVNVERRVCNDESAHRESGTRSTPPNSPTNSAPATSLFRRLLRNEYLRSITCAGLFAVLLIGLGYAFHGKTGLEKTLTKLIMPFGVFWLLLSGWFLQSLRLGVGKAFLATSTWLLITICSCGPISSLATRYLESQVENTELSLNEPLDFVVVLGGGTGQSPYRAQVASAGDRVVYGAQLYHEGYTKQLITTGSAIAGFGGVKRIGPRAQTIEIWTKLGIPREDILTLEGINTFEEIKSLHAALNENLAGKRVGLLTSASHLPRAMRLAKARGIKDLIPIAADHRASGHVAKTFMHYIPSAGALDQLARTQHEFMARLVNR